MVKTCVSHAVVARIDRPLLLLTTVLILMSLIGGTAARPILVCVPIITTITVVAGVARASAKVSILVIVELLVVVPIHALLFCCQYASSHTCLC